MKQSRRTLLTTFGLTLSGFILIAVSSGNLSFSPDRLARRIVSGIQRVFSATGQGIAGSVRAVGELRELRSDYEALLAELDRFERIEGTIDALERENARLREQLGFAARAELPTIAARVIAKEDGPVFSSFTINRGTRHGVQPGQSVIAFSDGREGLVGRVVQTTGGTSVVMPVFASGSYVAARLDESRHEGILQGGGDVESELVLRYVIRDARNEIRYNDLVVSSGMNSIYPRDIPIGRVLRVTAPSYETSLRIEVDPVVDFSRLEYVFVLQQGAGGGNL